MEVFHRKWGIYSLFSHAAHSCHFQYTIGTVGGLLANASGFFAALVKEGLRNSHHDKITTFSSLFYIKWKLLHLSCFKILARLRLLCLAKFIYLLACFVNLSQTLKFTLAESLILLGSLHPIKWASTKTISSGQMSLFCLLFRVFDGSSWSWLSLFDTLAWQFLVPQVICNCINAKIKSQSTSSLSSGSLSHLWANVVQPFFLLFFSESVYVQVIGSSVCYHK